MDRNMLVLEQARVLVSRLERLSADSIWAHRVSGYRGALLRAIDAMEKDGSVGDNAQWKNDTDLQRLEDLLKTGYDLLEKAARDLIE